MYIEVRTPTIKDIEAVLLDEEIYEKASDDFCPKREDIDLELLLEKDTSLFLGAYIEGKIAALFSVNNNEMHFEVLKPYRKHARIIWGEIIKHYPYPGYARVPVIYKSMINFAKKAGFKESKVIENAYKKNGVFYNMQELIYEGTLCQW
jgi:hypothetical protein